MALRLLNLRCDDCTRTRQVRRPLQPNLVAAAAQASKCHWCHPEFLNEICPSCLIPFLVVPCHAHGLCYSCYISGLRWKAVASPATAVRQVASTGERKRGTHFNLRADLGHFL